MNPELRKRIITAVIGVGVLLTVLLSLGRFGASLFGAVVSLGMCWEFGTLTFSLSDRFEKRLALVGCAWLIAFFNFVMPNYEMELLVLGFLGFSSYYLMTAGRHTSDGGFERHFLELMFSIFGLVYLSIIPLYLPLIRSGAHGEAWILLFLFEVWAIDVGAYFAGRKYGRRKLYPIISPKKTWEGVWGGMAFAFVVSLTFKFTFFRALPWSGAVVLPILIGWVSQLGDLCESFLKRAFSAKDSGSLLPGHGGFLDRFDGVIFSLPVMYACTRIFS